MEKLKTQVAYACAEFGIDGLPLNGGLGILAGDNIKSCADLHLPVVGLGLFYKKGNSRQSIDSNGMQHDYYEPFFPTGRLNENLNQVHVPLNGNEIPINSFRMPVFSSIPGDDYHNNIILLNDKDNLDGLYPGRNERSKRLIQEIILGIGGVRELAALGYGNIEIYHANEGHAALMAYALKEKYGSYEEARKHMVFTTHTPVPAGIDIYSKEEAEKEVRAQILTELRRLTGREDLHMMILAMASSFNSFGVSPLHRKVSKNQFCYFPNMDKLGYVDNGIHIPTWVSPEFEEIYDKVTDRRWRTSPKVLEEKINAISDSEIIT